MISEGALQLSIMQGKVALFTHFSFQSTMMALLISQLVNQLQEAAKVGPLEISCYMVAIRITKHCNLLTY